MAMVADGLRCFLVASRQNFCFRKQFFLPEAPQADSISVPRNQRFPLVVLLPLFLPALRLLPGHTPAHELKCFADANWPMSGPTSANTLAAPFSFIPGTVCSNFHRGGIPQSFDFGPDLLIQLQNRLLQKTQVLQAVVNHRAMVATQSMPFQSRHNLRNLGLRSALRELRDLRGGMLCLPTGIPTSTGRNPPRCLTGYC